MDHDFEDIEVKENSIELLEETLRKKRKKCMIGMGSMTDPYIPEEKRLTLTRRALELVERYGFGLTLITKSDGVLRDIDLLQRINEKTKAVVQMTLTTFDEDLCRKVEPNVSSTKKRFEALKDLQKAGVPTVVWICPILPFINDTKENLQGILGYCMEAKVYGVLCFGMGLTLRQGNREYFYQELDKKFPGLKEKYIGYYGNTYGIQSPNNKELMRLFHETCEKMGIIHNNREVFQYLNTFEEKNKSIQLSLFDE